MNSVIRASNHDYVKRTGHIPGKIVIYDNVWIAANCVVLPNVTIGSGSVIGVVASLQKIFQKMLWLWAIPVNPKNKLYGNRNRIL